MRIDSASVEKLLLEVERFHLGPAGLVYARACLISRRWGLSAIHTNTLRVTGAFRVAEELTFASLSNRSQPTR
jgi:hypothetical protein